MRHHRADAGLLAAALTIAAAGAAVTTSLVGCGSGHRIVRYPNGGSTPSPSPSPIGGSPSPSPSPLPSPSPSPGGAALGSFFSGFSSAPSDSFTYNRTTSVVFSPDPYGDSDSYSSQTTVTGANPFDLEDLGGVSTATVVLPNSGSKTVSRQEHIYTVDHTVSGYNYFTDDAAGHHDYGSDSLYLETTDLYHTLRNDPEKRTAYTLTPGQSDSQTYTEYDQWFASGGIVTRSYSFPISQTVTFVGVESITVPAGTYPSTAHYRRHIVCTYPAAGTNGNDEPEDLTQDFWVSPFVGVVKEVDHGVLQNIAGHFGGSSYTYQETSDVTLELASATVGGTNYPPGRAATGAAAAAQKTKRK